ncbi:MAG: RluA family pseudouridine synthase [Flavobacteriales bacterium]|jgi:23S rRNA pseudouridine1911/1915/1917 synthase|tara:strand:+ start:3368 stop:4039 length:672 start_codon:yes stop_codon:yes gene_type:complete
MLEVLYEDNHIIVVNKKAGDLVQGDKTGDKPLGEFVKSYLREKYNKPGNIFCGVIHRLDRPVSGAVIFAKTSKALTRMNKLFREKTIQKTYWAIVEKPPLKKEDRLEHYLIKNQQKNKSRAYSKPYEGALKSVLDYVVLKTLDRYTLVKVEPISGRHHQIRVQLSTIGCCIKGDLKYGAKRSNKDASISLHAREISFIHPVKNEAITVTAPTPKDALWNACKI